MVKRFILSLAILLISVISAHAEMMSIDADKVRLRSGPGTDYAILWELGLGYPLKVIDRKGAWIKISDFEGDEGWVHKDLVAKTPHLIVKKKSINVRNGPGTKYKMIGKAKYGVVFKTLQRSKNKNWVKVKHENGLTGWVRRDLLWGW